MEVPALPCLLQQNGQSVVSLKIGLFSPEHSQFLAEQPACCSISDFTSANLGGLGVRKGEETTSLSYQQLRSLQEARPYVNFGRKRVLNSAVFGIGTLKSLNCILKCGTKITIPKGSWFYPLIEMRKSYNSER